MFIEELHITHESVGDCHIKVNRSSGARGCIAVPYKTYDVTSKEGKDYKAVEGELIFENDVFE